MRKLVEKHLPSKYQKTKNGAGFCFEFREKNLAAVIYLEACNHPDFRAQKYLSTQICASPYLLKSFGNSDEVWITAAPFKSHMETERAPASERDFLADEHDIACSLENTVLPWIEDTMQFHVLTALYSSLLPEASREEIVTSREKHRSVFEEFEYVRDQHRPKFHRNLAALALWDQELDLWAEHLQQYRSYVAADSYLSKQGILELIDDELEQRC